MASSKLITIKFPLSRDKVADISSISPLSDWLELKLVPNKKTRVKLPPWRGNGADVIPFDKGLRLEMSASLTLDGGNLTCQLVWYQI